MEEVKITPETSELAIDKGCDLDLFGDGFDYVDVDGNEFWTKFEGGVSGKEETKPVIKCTQSLLQKWLYEKHQIWAECVPLFSANEQVGVHLSIASWKFPPILIEEDDEFDVYKGFEKVLYEALKLI